MINKQISINSSKNLTRFNRKLLFQIFECHFNATPKVEGAVEVAVAVSPTVLWVGGRDDRVGPKRNWG